MTAVSEPPLAYIHVYYVVLIATPDQNSSHKTRPGYNLYFLLMCVLIVLPCEIVGS